MRLYSINIVACLVLLMCLVTQYAPIKMKSPKWHPPVFKLNATKGFILENKRWKTVLLLEQTRIIMLKKQQQPKNHKKKRHPIRAVDQHPSTDEVFFNFLEG